MKKYSYNLISRYRTQLMGLAMLWVLFYHMSITVHFPILSHLKQIGYGGVDIFLMLSGLGLYYSYQKSSNCLSFYKRRLQRIVPTYFPVVISYYLLLYVLNLAPLKALFYNATTLSFWFHTNYMFDWYIPSIIMLYLITPFILSILKKQTASLPKYLVIGIFTLVSLGLSLFIIHSKFNYLIIFTSRIPIFLIGILIGYWSESNKAITSKHLLIHLVSLVIGLSLLFLFINYFDQYLWRYGLWWWPFILITLPLCVFSCLLLNVMMYLHSKILGLLTFFGILSLEIYLFHERLLYLLTVYFEPLGSLILNVIAILLALIFAYIWRKIIDSFTSYKLINN